MNRWIPLLSLSLVSLFAGLIATSFGEQSATKRSSSWQPTSLPEKSLETRAVEMLVNSTRWELIDDSDQQNRQAGEFFGSYRLVAVVANNRSYAVLEAIGLETTEPVFRVAIGDRLPNNWVVTEIEKAAVVATREGESQRVELFPEH